METVVYAVGSLAAIVCAWFALQILLKMMLGMLKLGVLAMLAYFAASVTWQSAEIPDVTSSDVAKLINFVEKEFAQFQIPKFSVELKYAEEKEPAFSKIGFEDTKAAKRASNYF